MSEALPFNPDVLHWARTYCGLPLEAAARYLQTTPERVKEWEDPDGKKRPTVKQARKLAALYGRPFLEFFAKAIPDVADVELAPDYRFHRKPPTDIEISALKEVHRWAEEQRLNALDLLELLGERPPNFPRKLRATVEDSAEEAAKLTREAMGFSVDVQFDLKAADRRKLPDILRDLFTDCGVLVLKQSGLKQARTRGVCLYASPLPIILYGNEAPSAQAFTLCHEFAHVLVQESAMSAKYRFKKADTEGKRVENWCNAFSAAFLMPAGAISRFVEKPDKPADSIGDDILSDVAAIFAVSRHALLIRLVDLGYVKSKYYWKVKRPQFIQEEENYKAPPMRSSYYGSRYKNSRGNFYTGLVLQAWGNGSITGHNAAEFMGIKNLRHLDDIRKNFR